MENKQQMANYEVNGVLIDTCSLVDIMFYECFNKLGLQDKDPVPGLYKFDLKKWHFTHQFT